MAYYNPINLFILLAFVFYARAQVDVIDDWNFQHEMKRRKEKDGDATMDLQFEAQITTIVDRPTGNRKLPKRDEVERLYESEKDRLLSEAQAAGDDLLNNATVNVKPGFQQYYELFDWKKNVKKCCPLKWKYQCRGTDVRLPCFYDYNNNNGKLEWCCPFWPRVIIKRCDCCQCAVLTSACAHEGQCRNRYSWKSFLAVCYRNGRWGYLKYVSKPLPSSCYCRI